jgi:hypothetical protein
MTRSVSLEQLPAGLEFPADILHRIRYDSSRRQLAFDGFMSKADFDRLARLHRDIQYQRALEQRFRICTLEPPATSKKSHLWLWCSAGVAAALLLFAVIMLLRR